MLQTRVEQVITEFNKAMEESGTRMEKIKMIVLKEAEAIIASLEDAEARRQEKLGVRMNKLIEKLTGDLEAMGQQEEELRQFSASLAPVGSTCRRSQSEWPTSIDQTARLSKKLS